MDVETIKEMSQHPYCAPGSTEGLISGTLSKFKDRMLPQADSVVLQCVFEKIGERNDALKIYDLSRMGDSLRALRHGIRSTPVVVIDGKKYQGLEVILRVLSDLKPSLAI
jgi:hypothetical protein